MSTTARSGPLTLLFVLLGAVLIIDEIWIFLPGLGSPGWILGDWSAWHVEPFHHWMFGAALMIMGLVALVCSRRG